MEGKVIDSLDYRGYHIDFYDDDYGQQVYAFIDNEEVCFGSFNMSYKQDAVDIIDSKLDTIHRFDCGARLTWFQNGAYRDIKLIYRLRIIKVWLVIDETKVNINTLIEKSKEILDTIMM